LVLQNENVGGKAKAACAKEEKVSKRLEPA
jgi:hypothetical protein